MFIFSLTPRKRTKRGVLPPRPPSKGDANRRLQRPQSSDRFGIAGHAMTFSMKIDILPISKVLASRGSKRTKLEGGIDRKTFALWASDGILNVNMSYTGIT